MIILPAGLAGHLSDLSGHRSHCHPLLLYQLPPEPDSRTHSSFMIYARSLYTEFMDINKWRSMCSFSFPTYDYFYQKITATGERFKEVFCFFLYSADCTVHRMVREGGRQNIRNTRSRSILPRRWFTHRSAVPAALVKGPWARSHVAEPPTPVQVVPLCVDLDGAPGLTVLLVAVLVEVTGECSQPQNMFIQDSATS